MQKAEAAQQAQPLTKDYLRIGVILFVLTVLEVAVIYVDALRPMLTAILVILSVWKFLLVVNVFMHLKFDSRVYTGFFTVGMALAVIITAALVAMFAGR